MNKECVTCDKLFYVSPSRTHIKNCSYECNKIYRKSEAIKIRQTLIDCLCGCRTKITAMNEHTGRKRYVNGHQNYSRRKPKIVKTNHQVGEKHWNWKGGVTSEDKKLRQVFRATVQQRIFLRDNYTCTVCDSSGGYLQVDHIRSWADYPELRFVDSNCRTLCMACHYYITFKRKLPQGVVWGHNLSRRIES